MPLTDDAVLIPGTGAIWTGTVGTATKPTLTQLGTFVSAGTVVSGWDHAGHTSDDNLPKPGTDGGSTDAKNSWQAKPLRSTITPGTDYWDIDLLQIQDNAVMSWYYGGGDASVTNEFALPDTPTAVEKAVAMIFIDGTNPVCYYAPKMSLFAGDSISMDSGEFTILPVRFTLLQVTGQKKAIWIGANFGT